MTLGHCPSVLEKKKVMANNFQKSHQENCMGLSMQSPRIKSDLNAYTHIQEFSWNINKSNSDYLMFKHIESIICTSFIFVGFISIKSVLCVLFK